MVENNYTTQSMEYLHTISFIVCQCCNIGSDWNFQFMDFVCLLAFCFVCLFVLFVFLVVCLCVSGFVCLFLIYLFVCLFLNSRCSYLSGSPSLTKPATKIILPPPIPPSMGHSNGTGCMDMGKSNYKHSQLKTMNMVITNLHLKNSEGQNVFRSCICLN